MTLLLLQKVNLLGRAGLDLRMYSHLGLTGMKLAGLDLAEFVSTCENSVSRTRLWPTTRPTNETANGNFK